MTEIARTHTSARPRASAAAIAGFGPRVRFMRAQRGGGEAGRRARAAAEGVGGADRPPKQRFRVLLVDDDEALRMLYRFNLEASGVEVDEAADGETALRLLERGDLPDVLLLDVMMPGLDGWKVAERLAADPRTRRLPIVFITARAEDAARERAQTLGAAGYLTKPFNPAMLADEVERMLAASRAAADDPDDE